MRSRMPNLPACLGRHAVAWAYLVGFVTADIVLRFLSPAGRSTVQQWASTNVVNLRHDPLGSLVVSAFVSTGDYLAWPFLIAMAMFGANRALGNWRTVVVCGAGHVLGTLASEGILAYRIAHGLLPESDSRIIDVGPSYIAVAAITVAVLYGSWPARIVAAIDFLLLVVVGGIFSGLSTLQVAAVGHATSIVVAAILGSALAWRLRRAQSEAARHDAPRGGLRSHHSSEVVSYLGDWPVAALGVAVTAGR